MRNAMSVARHARAIPPHAARPLIALVFEGLSEEQKQLPASLLFDAEGSRLFERVCAQPEYYLRRAESELLRRHGAEIAALAGPQVAVVESEAGAGHQGELLLAALEFPLAYVAVDIEATQLVRARGRLRERFPTLLVDTVCQDFRQFPSLPAVIGGARRRLAYFPGSSVGALRSLETVALLNSVRESMGPGGGMLVGIDLVKDASVHERACNDAAGAMAAFNRNLLVRLNREVDATFDVGAFQHRAAWNDEHQRIEMSLVSTRAQTPTIAGIGVAVAAGERILTMLDHKFTLEGFASLARIAGWSARDAWVDAENLYALQFLEAAE
jgi:L-histidine Nalpha-methyltransferase